MTQLWYHESCATLVYLKLRNSGITKVAQLCGCKHCATLVYLKLRNIGYTRVARHWGYQSWMQKLRNIAVLKVAQLWVYQSCATFASSELRNIGHVWVLKVYIPLLECHQLPCDNCGINECICCLNIFLDNHI